MSRGNLILLGVLALAVGLWLLGRGSTKDKPTGPAPRLFPEFNREGAELRIEISGGPSGTAWTIAQDAGGTSWSLASAGGYPVKRAEADRFLDAISSLRRENAVGTSAAMRESTRTDDKGGRLVRVIRADAPVAELYVGKNPKQGYSEFFVRKAGEDTVYRTHTVLAKEQGTGVSADPYAAGPSGFDWHNYTENLSTKWVDTSIWDLGSAEVEEISLTRPGVYEAKVVKQAEDKWELVEAGKEPAPADADVADGILSVVRRLTLYDVLGTYDDVKKEYGLEEPETKLEMKLRKKVEKPAPKEGEAAEGEEKKDEYTTFDREIEIGKKVSRTQYDYSGEPKSEDYYAIHVGPADNIENADEKMRAGYVFLVRDYTASQIRKELLDLRLKPEEEEGKGPGEGEGPAEETPPVPEDEGKPPEETPPPGEAEKPADEGTAEPPKEGGCGEKDKGDGCGEGDEGSEKEPG